MTAAVHHARPGRLRLQMPAWLRHRHAVTAAPAPVPAEPAAYGPLPGQPRRVPGASYTAPVLGWAPPSRALLQQVLDGLRNLSGEARAPFSGVSLPGLPGPPDHLLQGVVAVKEHGEDTVTFPAVRDPGGDSEDEQPAYLRSVDHPDRAASWRLQERLTGLPAYLDTAVVDGVRYAGLSLGRGDDSDYVVDESSPDRLEGLALAAIAALPQLTPDVSDRLERIIFAAQTALAASTRGGPVVEQQDGAQATGGAA
jgi:hypothetical protein